MPTVDADGDWGADYLWAGGAGRGFAGHRIGRDAAYLSPHAGLRANVLELARLARFLGTSPAGEAAMAPAWAFDGGNGRTGGGLFLRYGQGVTLTGADPRLPRVLAGHGGHALGFTGGAWWDPAQARAFAYVLTGSADETEGHDDEVFHGDVELALLEAL
ncbi:MAG: hypothetical protein ACU0CO_03335 [Shimia sp.]